MEVKLGPAMNGCLTALLAVTTLGLTLIIMPILQRRCVRRMDEAGFETRGGKRVAWSEITRVTRATGTMKSVTLSDELPIDTPRGRASLPVWRIGNGEEVADYFLRRAPDLG